VGHASAQVLLTDYLSAHSQEIDLNQAHEISKHIVTEIINQAVDILKKENHTNAQPISGQQFNLKRMLLVATYFNESSLTNRPTFFLRRARVILKDLLSLSAHGCQCGQLQLDQQGPTCLESHYAQRVPLHQDKGHAV